MTIQVITKTTEPMHSLREWWQLNGFRIPIQSGQKAPGKLILEHNAYFTRDTALTSYRMTDCLFFLSFLLFFFFLILSKKIELVTHGLCILQILPPARNFNHSQPLLSHLSQLRRLQLLKGTCDFHNIFLSYWSKPFKPLYFITCYSTPNGLWTRGNGLDK